MIERMRFGEWLVTIEVMQYGKIWASVSRDWKVYESSNLDEVQAKLLADQLLLVATHLTTAVEKITNGQPQDDIGYET